MARDMIEEALKLIKREENLSYEEAFDKLLTYLAIGLYIGYDISIEFKSDVLQKLDAIIDLDVIKNSKEEFLYDVYYKYVSQVNVITPELSRVTMLAVMTKETFPAQVFIETINTSAMVSFPKNIMVYTISNNLVKYRMDLINRKLFDIPIFILYIYNYKKEDLELMATSVNWEFCNKWIPVKKNHLTKRLKS